MTARFIVGDSLTVLRALPDQSVNTVITSPPYLKKRSYLPDDHPEKSYEIGQEDSPGEFLNRLLDVTDELWRIVRDDGSIWINLGDTAAQSGGAGGDYNPGGLRDGQPKFEGMKRRSGTRPGRLAEAPLPKSVCWIPQLFGASLAYGRNLLTGRPCQQWVTRPPITWCKPNPVVGEVLDKCREATELIVFAVKNSKPGGYYFDLDAIREPTDPANERATTSADDPKAEKPGQRVRFTARRSNPKGAPPKDWWVVSSDPFLGAHFAVFPPELITRPVIAACPPNGVILDPFAGSGTTLMVAEGHGRNSIGIDFDERNADLAGERVGMFLEVESALPQPPEAVA